MILTIGNRPNAESSPVAANRDFPRSAGAGATTFPKSGDFFGLSIFDRSDVRAVFQAKQRRSRIHRTRGAFTLIELVLVMAILIVVLSISGPSLVSFFRGRTLDSEARRFLALTRYGQSRAISEGVPVLLWIDPQENKYGLEIEAGYADIDRKAAEYSLGKDLTVEVSVPLRPVVVGSSVAGKQLQIRFTPDGFISEANPETIIFREKKTDVVLLTPNRNRLSYEIQTNNLQSVRR